MKVCGGRSSSFPVMCYPKSINMCRIKASGVASPTHVLKPQMCASN